MSLQHASAMRLLFFPPSNVTAFRSSLRITPILARDKRFCARTIATLLYTQCPAVHLRHSSLAGVRPRACTIDRWMFNAPPRASCGLRIRTQQSSPSSSKPVPALPTLVSTSRGPIEKMYATLRALHVSASQPPELNSQWLHHLFAVARPFTW